MPADITFTGADRLESVARDLKQAGATQIRKDLLKGIQRATKPMQRAAKEAARQKLPQRGGLNVFVASSKFSTSTRTAGKNPGVAIKVKKSGHDIRAIDRGRLRHPVFGNKNVWVDQQITPGVFTETFEDGAPSVRKELLDVLEDVAKKIAG